MNMHGQSHANNQRRRRKTGEPSAEHIPRQQSLMGNPGLNLTDGRADFRGPWAGLCVHSEHLQVYDLSFPTLEVVPEATFQWVCIVKVSRDAPLLLGEDGLILPTPLVLMKLACSLSAHGCSYPDGCHSEGPSCFPCCCLCFIFPSKWMLLYLTPPFHHLYSSFSASFLFLFPWVLLSISFHFSAP